jgi:hypothetical protein
VNQNKFQDCLGDNELEVYIRRNCDPAEELRIARHIQECYYCFNRSFDLRMFNEILTWELQKPISLQVINWVREFQEG